MGLYWSLFQVLDHHVGNPGQMTHVASSGASLRPDSHINTWRLEKKLCSKTLWISHILNVLKAKIVKKKLLTVFYHSPPRHSGSSEQADTSGKAEGQLQTQRSFMGTKLPNTWILIRFKF